MKARVLFTSTVVLLVAASASAQQTGILLLAHGGNATWDGHVRTLAADVDRTMPTEVAFGMATRANMQAAIDRLSARGAGQIVAVPLFISSWSSVITSTEYLLGQRAEAPQELAIFASMNHGAPGAGTHAAGDHADHSPAASADGTTPVVSPVRLRMTRALNDHPIVADILLSRARSISANPAQEAVVIVAHGPGADEENQRWLSDMASLARQMREQQRFASIDYLTLRDDAAAPIRDAATREIRELVSTRLAEGRRVLIVPLLISFGGIERGLRQRLEGLSYTMPEAALVPDDRLASWVLAMAREATTPPR